MPVGRGRTEENNGSRQGDIYRQSGRARPFIFPVSLKKARCELVIVLTAVCCEQSYGQRKTEGLWALRNEQDR